MVGDVIVEEGIKFFKIINFLNLKVVLLRVVVEQF